MNTKELENSIASVEARCLRRLQEGEVRIEKKLDDLLLNINQNYITRPYYDARRETIIERLTRFEGETKRDIEDLYNNFKTRTVLTDSFMTEVKTANIRSEQVKKEVEAIEKAMDELEKRCLDRYEKTLEEVVKGLDKVHEQIDSKGPRNLSVAVSVFSLLAMGITVALFIIQHFHP